MNIFKKQFHRIAAVAAIFALLLCIGVVAGCSKADTNNIKTEFTAKELLADYDKLWEMLEEDYLYFPILESRGVNIEALRESTRQRLVDRVTDFDSFYYLLNDMFYRMEYFAHLSIVTPEQLEVYREYYTEGSGWKKTFQNPQTEAVYEYLKSKSDNSFTDTNADTNGYREVEASYDTQRKAVTFVITTFDSAVLERDKDFIINYLSTLGNAEIDHIIFDISGNAGGNDLYWQNNIVAPFGGIYEWTNYLYLRNTELTRSYFFGDFAPKPISEIKDHQLPDFVQELGLTHFIKNNNRLAGVGDDAILGDNALSAKRWVIIDDRVYSSADSFSAFCKATGWATLVGQTTLGDGQGTSPVMISLPNTGLLVRFSALAAETPNGTLNAVTGTEPDIPVDSSVSLRDTVNELIDKDIH